MYMCLFIDLMSTYLADTIDDFVILNALDPDFVFQLI